MERFGPSNLDRVIGILLGVARSQGGRQPMFICSLQQFNHFFQALTPEFSQLLSQLLYTQPELRTDVLRALTVMVTSNAAIASGDSEKLEKLPKGVKADMISQDIASANLAFLRSQTESWLAVFFNVYSTAGGDGQGTISEVISSWVSIADGKVGYTHIFLFAIHS